MKTLGLHYPMTRRYSLAAVDLSAGVVGLTLSYCIMLTGVFQPFIEESAELENLVSVMHHRGMNNSARFL